MNDPFAAELVSHGAELDSSARLVLLHHATSVAAARTILRDGHLLDGGLGIWFACTLEGARRVPTCERVVSAWVGLADIVDTDIREMGSDDEWLAVRVGRMSQTYTPARFA